MPDNVPTLKTQLRSIRIPTTRKVENPLQTFLPL